MTKKTRITVSLSKEAYDKLLLLRHECIAGGSKPGKEIYLYTFSEVIEYCILFGPLKVSR